MATVLDIYNGPFIQTLILFPAPMGAPNKICLKILVIHIYIAPGQELTTHMMSKSFHILIDSVNSVIFWKKIKVKVNLGSSLIIICRAWMPRFKIIGFLVLTKIFFFTEIERGGHLGHVTKTIHTNCHHIFSGSSFGEDL